MRVLSVVCALLLCPPPCSAKKSSTGFGALLQGDIEAALPGVVEAWKSAGDVCLASRAPGSTGVDSGAIALGCQADLLLPALKFVYQGKEESGAILDVGAHVGRWAAEVLTTFGKLESRKYTKEFGQEDVRCPSLPPGGSVMLYSFEPAAKNYERLTDRGKRSGWQLEGFSVMKAAVSNASGKVQLFASPGEVDASASLAPRDGISPATEKAVTLDLVLKKSIQGGKAFLIRVAVNGHEHQAVAGAKKSLKAGIVRFLLFEQSALSPAGSEDRLKETTSMLWKLGYACFALLPQPVPLSGVFWQATAGSTEHAGPQWFFVLCGRLDDPGLKRVLQILEPSAADFLRTPAAA
eukprot:TRINITY_DN23020_c0_g1_i1.p1 TRINITY_DN23020_c0_g1~~TRINITY_DN23020_c0_g1_i1.p1  ORF type:complete len:351 (-),score=59.14 TRINITY_DN23020_c0_g1_i1:17-1069(-)